MFFLGVLLAIVAILVATFGKLSIEVVFVSAATFLLGAVIVALKGKL